MSRAPDPSSPSPSDPPVLPRRLLYVGDPLLASATDADRARAYLAVAPDDAARRHVLAAVADQPDTIAVRTCRPGHLTGSALVVDATATRTLLLFHTKLQRWLQPGGHADGDTNLAAVALREATEETGIDRLGVWPEPVDVDIHEVRPPAEDPHLHLDVRFLVVAPADATVVGNHESTELRWVEWNRLHELGVDEGLRRLADRARSLASAILAAESPP